MNFKELTMIGATTSAGLEITYGYNGEGYRVLKSSNGKTINYLYEGAKVILEVDGNGVEKARSVNGTNQISRTISGEVLYYMYNGHADVTQLTNILGETVATYYYDAFGEIIDSSGSADNPIRYAGYQYDEETGLYYLNARMYDPTIARFLQEDTYTGNINDPLSLNLYAYCNNNPLVYYDPTGHFGTTTGNGVPYEILHPGKSSTGTSTWNNGVPKEIQDKTNKSSSTSSKGTSAWNNGVPKEVQSKINKSNTSKSTTGTNSWNNGVPKIIQDKIDKNLKDLDNPIMKSLNSFKEIGYDFKYGLEIRTEKALDSPYDFANYMTIGISGNFCTGLKDRADKMTDSPYDFFNWLTLGVVGMGKEAIAPEDPFSKEHWMSSFGIVSLGFGGMQAGAMKSGISTTVAMETETNLITKGVSKAVSLNPNEIRFSQSSVNGAEEIIQSMKTNGWKGDPIDVIRMGDGKLTTIDNTRVVAGREAGIKVQANIHNANELLPESLIDRFTTKKGVPTTWGEAIELRIGKQNASFRNNNPFGADAMERIGK